MPLIRKSAYRARGPFRYGHINTVFPALFRKVKGVTFERERVDTPDGDFLDRLRRSESDEGGPRRQGAYAAGEPLAFLRAAA